MSGGRSRLLIGHIREVTKTESLNLCVRKDPKDLNRRVLMRKDPNDLNHESLHEERSQHD